MGFKTKRFSGMEDFETWVRENGELVDHLSALTHGIWIVALYRDIPVVEPVDDSPEPVKAAEPVSNGKPTAEDPDKIAEEQKAAQQTGGTGEAPKTERATVQIPETGIAAALANGITEPDPALVAALKAAAHQS